jgi:hypothetical protein
MTIASAALAPVAATMTAAEPSRRLLSFIVLTSSQKHFSFERSYRT